MDEEFLLVPPPFFPGTLLIENLRKPRENRWLWKRTMVEKNGESTPREFVLLSANPLQWGRGDSYRAAGRSAVECCAPFLPQILGRMLYNRSLACESRKEAATTTTCLRLFFLRGRFPVKTNQKRVPSTERQTHNTAKTVTNHPRPTDTEPTTRDQRPANNE